MIYDCFTFFNELDLLEIRLNILNDVADKFVIVEATKTFSGVLKPLYFNENKERFKKFENKIIHVIVDDMPEFPESKRGSEYWALEFFQRNAIIRGLRGCKDDDVLLIGDLDQIPNPKAVVQYCNYSGIKVLKQKMFLYYLNNIDLQNPYWTNSSTRMLSYHDFVENGSTPQKTIFLRGYLINNGGWHFSYLGGTEKIAQKVQSFGHVLSKDIVKKYQNPDSVKEKMVNGMFLYDSNGKKRFAGIPIDQSFPKYIIDNARSKYSHLICPVNITWYDKLTLFRNGIKCTTLAYVKNIFFAKNINRANYEQVEKYEKIH